jgi:putative membrane protein
MRSDPAAKDPILHSAMSIPDPRVFFAAERTLLAWLRTGLTIIALGFVVARFGLFLQLLSAQSLAGSAHAQAGPSAALGVVFVVVGAIAILVATVQHQRYVSTLQQSDLPPSYNRTFAVALSALIGVMGLLLAAYLSISHA